jgi:uncharacterized protein YndB with AHSA1/START domain
MTTTSFHVCPTDVVDAPAEAVWAQLVDPARWPAWADGVLVAAPARPLTAGDRLRLATGPLRLFSVRFEVLDVRPIEELRLAIALPLGLTNDETVRVTPLGPRACRLTFSRDFRFPPGWRGRLVQRAFAGELVRGPAESLARLKRAAEAAGGDGAR